ncbi:thioredoxin domain-containing protein [Maribacter algicola]|uniref:Thioredoxin domain-containing protein n=1 Tax=Maribacter algicola TaxID=2498892 RepID=A0A426RGG6_9FLAO|nr:thioredoxin domain-containing protein [Maribacter algicola]RRQ47989.1 thioredoxin domain-containing protein [Maribacter algicola]
MKSTSRFLMLVCLFSFLSCKNSRPEKEIKKEDNELLSNDFEYTNELIAETSPYLLQHAHNPVNWKPWSDKAFTLAKEKNSLILLSIGYSTCHWCHVMEEESFEDIEVAQMMNDNFISIKVDREERPDVDIVYQTALELVQESGGWPLNAILLPNGKPVYLGTYHDKETWKSIISKFSLEYKNNPEKMEEYAKLLTSGIQDVYSGSVGSNEAFTDTNTIHEGISKWSKQWDSDWGGDVGGQKFINPSKLNFLLNYAFLSKDMKAKDHLRKTLDAILLGGIHDHLGGGFFRYSTDGQWKIPHFEKMLYDNAQILSLYAKAYRAFKDPKYLKALETTLNFIERDMKGDQGGYISALDADTNGVEGAFYVWEEEELRFQLGDDFDLFSRFYSIQKEEEWENGKYILVKRSADKEFSNAHSISESELMEYSEKWKEILLKARQTRVEPKKDDKIITSWNAILIDGFIEAYKATSKETYLTKARSTFQFLLNHNYKNEQLVHSYKEGSKQKEVFLEDYAFMAKTALNLYESTFELDYLELAKKFNNTALEKFSDESGFFSFNEKNELIAKIISTADGVLPSANAIMAHNLLKLGHLDYNQQFLNSSRKMISSMITSIVEEVQNYGQWGSLMLTETYPYFEIVVVGPNARKISVELNTYFIPNALIVGSEVPNESPLFQGRFLNNETYIYICQNRTCKLPVQTIEEALVQLSELGSYGWTQKRGLLPF